MENVFDTRSLLGETSSLLGKIHKLILESEMETLELLSQKPLAPAERLNALLTNPDLAWLRNLSQLMGYVDEFFFQKEAVSLAQFQMAEQKVVQLFNLDNESEFSYRYKKCLGSVPDLMVAHGHLKVLLKKISEHSKAGV